MSPEREYAYIKRKQRTDSGPIPWQSVSWRYPWQFVSRCRCVSISSSIVLVLLADPECERKVRVSAPLRRSGLPRGSQQSPKVRNLSGLCRAHCILAKLQALIVMLGFAAFLCFHLCSQPHCEWRKRGPIWRPCASNSCHIYGATL